MLRSSPATTSLPTRSRSVSRAISEKPKEKNPDHMRKPAIPGEIRKPTGLTNDKPDGHEAGDDMISIESDGKTQGDSDVDTGMTPDGNSDDGKSDDGKSDDGLQGGAESPTSDNIRELTGLTDNDNSGDGEAGDDTGTIKSNRETQGKGDVDQRMTPDKNPDDGKSDDGLQGGAASPTCDNIRELTGLTDNDNSGDGEAGDDTGTIKSNRETQGKGDVDQRMTPDKNPDDGKSDDGLRDRSLVHGRQCNPEPEGSKPRSEPNKLVIDLREGKLSAMIIF